MKPSMIFLTFWQSMGIPPLPSIPSWPTWACFFGFGIFDDAMPHIHAACTYLRQMGFQKIIIAGHGLGGAMAIRYGALHQQQFPSPDIQGIIVIATAYSLPDTIRKRWTRFDSQPSYREVYERPKHCIIHSPGPICRMMKPLSSNGRMVQHSGRSIQKSIH